ncbi:MAG: hypothetical protein HY758_02440 [Nitrospirae bacterium]|nr:hypothetical protein [Nitrospirota bacterium]
MRHKIERLLIFISFLLLFMAFSFKYLSINLWDYDFWWHISSGRYISETGSLPDKDPFSYTSVPGENKNFFPERETFILKQYWLAQTVLFCIYNTFDNSGIIIFRALLFLIAVLLVLTGLRRNGVSLHLSFFFVLPAFYMLMSFTAERPVLFSILFSIIVFLLLDEFSRTRNRIFFLLVPAMMLWANMHGGFIFGIAMIAAFSAGEALNVVLKRSLLTKKELIVFISVCALAVACTYLNPTHFDAFLITASAKSKFFRENIEEHLPSFLVYKNNLRRLDISYIALLLLYPAVFISMIKKGSYPRLFVLAGLLLMSLFAFRFVIYFVLIGTIIIGTEIHCILGTLPERDSLNKIRGGLAPVLAGIAFLCSLFLFAGNARSSMFNFSEAKTRSVPASSVDFIEKYQLSGNIYNDFVFGGYVTWRLHPWTQNFIDTRSINSTALQEARLINSATRSIYNKDLPADRPPLWEKLLDNYSVDIVLLDTLNVHGTVTPLVLEMLKDDRWVPVNVDDISVVFIRNGSKNTDVLIKKRLQKNTVFNAVIARASKGALRNKINPNYLISIGDVFYAMGKKQDSLKVYEYAARKFPSHNLIRLNIDRVRKEL